MYLSALTALNRKDGKHVILASVAHAAAGRDTSKVAAAYRALVAGTKDGAEKRAKYSHCMLMIENQVRNTHQFPDLNAQTAKHEAKLARAKASGETAAAQKLLDEAAKAKAAADAQFEAARGKAIELGILEEDEETVAPEVVNPIIAAVKELRQKALALQQPARDAFRAVEDATGLGIEAAVAARDAGNLKPEHLTLVEAAISAGKAASQAQTDADQAAAALE